MISFDLECEKQHRFEGYFKDYDSFDNQLQKKMIACPVCDSTDVKRLFTGCSIQAQGSGVSKADDALSKINVFEILRMIRSYVENNFENVGKDFSEKARAIYYGIEEERNIYGEATPQETKELIDEGIGVMPVPAVEKIEN